MIPLRTREQCYRYHRAQYRTYQGLLHTKGKQSRQLWDYYKHLCLLAALRAERYLT